MSYYSEPDSHIIDKVKVVLDLSKYAAKKANYVLKEHATQVLISLIQLLKKGLLLWKLKLTN